MALSISGRIAAGADEALGEVLERRMKEQLRQDQERQRAADLILRQQGVDLQRETLEGAKQDRAADNLRQQQVVDLQLKKDAAAEAEKATNRNRASDIAGVLAMPGMADADKFREVSGLAVKAGADPMRMIEGLRPVKPDVKTYTYTDPRTGKQSLRTYDPAKVPEGGLDLGNEPQKPTRGGTHVVGDYLVDDNGKVLFSKPGAGGGGPGGQADAAQRYQQEQTDSVVRKINDLIGDPKDPTSRRDRINWMTAGVFGKTVSGFPIQTEAKNVAAELKSLGANLAFEQLTKMRNASKTGGSLGNVSDTEIGLLTNAVASIDQDQSPENLIRQLDIIRESAQRFSREAAKYGKTADDFKDGGGGSGGGGGKMTVEELKKKYGG